MVSHLVLIYHGCLTTFDHLTKTLNIIKATLRQTFSWALIWYGWTSPWFWWTGKSPPKMTSWISTAAYCRPTHLTWLPRRAWGSVRFEITTCFLQGRITPISVEGCQKARDSFTECFVVTTDELKEVRLRIWSINTSLCTDRDPSETRWKGGKCVRKRKTSKFVYDSLHVRQLFRIPLSSVAYPNSKAIKDVATMVIT